MKILHLLFAPLLLGALSAAEPTRIYLANDDHTDFMWTADADTYANVFVELLDFHLKLADETADNAAAFRNRFNADGALWLATYEQRKTPAEFARLIARIKDGTISVPLNTVVSCPAASPSRRYCAGCITPAASSARTISVSRSRPRWRTRRCRSASRRSSPAPVRRIRGAASAPARADRKSVV